MIAKDHLGKTYKSLAAMARAWGILYVTLTSRLDLGWTVEDALTRPAGYRACCKDHLGNEFESIKAMAEYWGLPDTTIRARLARGVSLEEALTKPLRKQRRKWE